MHDQPCFVIIQEIVGKNLAGEQKPNWFSINMMKNKDTTRLEVLFEQIVLLAVILTLKSNKPFWNQFF